MRRVPFGLRRKAPAAADTSAAAKSSVGELADVELAKAELVEGKYDDAPLAKNTQNQESGSRGDAVKDGMEPVSADALKDGVYEVRVDSSSGMFRITECELTVQDGAMSAVMTMSGTGYLKLYMGTGAEAEQASEADFIPFVENADGEHTFRYRWKRWTRILTAAPSAGKRKHGMTVCWYFVPAPFRQRLLPTVRRQRQRALSWKMVHIRWQSVWRAVQAGRPWRHRRHLGLRTASICGYYMGQFQL